jgi:hypothetical protein
MNAAEEARQLLRHRLWRAHYSPTSREGGQCKTTVHRLDLHQFQAGERILLEVVPVHAVLDDPPEVLLNQFAQSALEWRPLVVREHDAGVHNGAVHQLEGAQVHLRAEAQQDVPGGELGERWAGDSNT